MESLSRPAGVVLRLLMLVAVVFPQLIPAQWDASAQAEQSPIRIVRSLYTNEYGVEEPKGLAFSSTANTFLLLDGTSNITMITMGADHAGVRVIPDVQSDPLNVAFDKKSGGLFAFNRGKSELVKIRTDGRGVPSASLLPSRFASQAYGWKDPRGIAFDPGSGQLFVLDAGSAQIVSVIPDAAVGFDANQAIRSNKIQKVSLKKLGAGLHGLAYNPRNGHLYVAGLRQKKLYELTQDGSIIVTFDLASLGIINPTAMTFAPSADNTDDPNIYNLFLLDNGQAAQTASTGLFSFVSTRQQTTSSQAQIVELSLVAPAALPTGTTLLPSTLVNIIDASTWTHPSPDPSGVDYWPPTGGLLMNDSEIEESVNSNPPVYWHGFNVFQSTLSGSLMDTCTTFTSNPTSVVYNNFTNEPTGVAINPGNNHIFFTSDGSNSRVFEIGSGPDGAYCTADDTVTRTVVATLYGATDTEDAAYGNNTVFIADGINAEVYVIPLGANGVLDGGDDGPVTHFDTAALGFNDLEGIGFNSDAGTLFIVSTVGSENYLGEVTTSGSLLRAYNLSFMGTSRNLRSDVAYAPSSQNPGTKSIYIASRGIDNNNDPNENDGKIWEINIGSSGAATPTRTNTPAGTPSATRTHTPVNTPTNTRTPSATPTIPSGGSMCLAPVQDSYINQDKTTENKGSEKDLKIKAEAGKEKRIVVRFDLSSIPQNSAILSSTLRLYEEGKKDKQVVVTLHRLTNSWVESHVTWNNRASGAAWSTRGGDYDNSPLATFVANLDKKYREINVTSITQSWVNGSLSNHGLLLRAVGDKEEVKYKSREESDSRKKPGLCITYQLAPTATPMGTATQPVVPTATWTNTPVATATAATFTPTDTPLATDTPTAISTPTFTNTPDVPDLIFADGFESGDFSAWTSSTTDLGDLSVSGSAALVGSHGMQAVINDLNLIYVTDDRPNAESRYRARFYFDPNSISMASGDSHIIFFGYSAPSPFTPVLRVGFRNISGVYQLRASLWTDSSVWIDTTWYNISDAPHLIEVDWLSATAPSANDGSLTLWIDDTQQVTLSGADNDTWRIDRARLGGVSAIDAGTSGTYYFDAFESRRQTYIGP